MKISSFAQLLAPFLLHPVWQVQEDTIKLYIYLLHESAGSEASFDQTSLLKTLVYLVSNSVVQKVRFASREAINLLLNLAYPKERSAFMELIFEFCSRDEFYKLCDRIEIKHKDPEVFVDEDGYCDVRYTFR